MLLPLQGVGIYILLLYKFTHLVHLCLIILEDNGIRDAALDVVQRQAINIYRTGHQMPHQQSKAPNKQITLFYRPLQQQLEESAVDCVSLFLVCVTFFFSLRKLLLVAKQEGVNLGVKLHRQQLVRNLRAILYGIIELGHVGEG